MEKNSTFSAILIDILIILGAIVFVEIGWKLVKKLWSGFKTLMSALFKKVKPGRGPAGAH